MLRFAIAPTGDMHIEALRVAILNFIVAQQKKESFSVRIDDTNSKRNIEGKDSEIMQVLEKFALKHESVFHQSEHLHMHQTLAIKLLDQAKAFVCTCTDERLNADKEASKTKGIAYQYSGRCLALSKEKRAHLKDKGIPFVVRIKKPSANIITHDIIQGELTSTASEVDSFTILDAHGIPTPNFASACDDMLSGVTNIIRTDEQLSNTAKQTHIKMQLGYDAKTNYAHLPRLANTQKQMSIADDTPSLKWLLKEGFVPDAIINYLLLLGYDHAPQEVFTLPEAIEWFDLRKVSKSAKAFDIDTLRFINSAHLERMDNKALSTLFGFADADVGKLAKLYTKEVSTTTELHTKIKAIFSPKNFEGPYSTQMRTLENLVQNAPMIATYKDFKSYLLQESGLKEDKLIHALRLLLTGAVDGPKLNDMYPLIKSYLLEIAS